MRLRLSLVALVASELSAQRACLKAVGGLLSAESQLDAAAELLGKFSWLEKLPRKGPLLAQ